MLLKSVLLKRLNSMDRKPKQLKTLLKYVHGLIIRFLEVDPNSSKEKVKVLLKLLEDLNEGVPFARSCVMYGNVDEIREMIEATVPLLISTMQNEAPDSVKSVSNSGWREIFGIPPESTVNITVKAASDTDSAKGSGDEKMVDMDEEGESSKRFKTDE